MSVESGDEAQNSRHACAACKHQRKKCQNDCIFSPHFPATKANNFREVHKIFGVKNATFILEKLSPDERKQAVDSLEWEAFAWKKDPVRGPLGLYRELEEKFESFRNQQNPHQNTMAAPHQTSSDLAAFNQNSSGIVPDSNMNVTNFGYANNVQNFGLDETINDLAGLLQRADNIAILPPVGPNYYPVPQGQRRSDIMQEGSLDAVSQTSTLLPRQEMQRNIIYGSNSSTMRPAANGFNQERQRMGSQGRYHPYYNGSVCGSQRRGLHVRSNIADKQ